ncbi:ANTAR domain-containing protein [Cryobacterium algoritolerans]|uniref:ANTAR domain-containing protein n=2 Tax=Cryobacterium algoritolerans TaxID=1259184 RepID=A0A4R8WPH4_9MICO|nr:ANTAR domain-containing protein [Cryobacterium algoritolerans]
MPTNDSLASSVGSRARRRMGGGLMSSDRRAFAAAALELSEAKENTSNLCGPFLSSLPITGASISTLGAPFGTETVCASDEQAAQIDEIQFDLGEGPCWDAISIRRPVLSADIRNPSASWPMFVRAIETTDVVGLFAFPMFIGSLNIGAVELYSTRRGSMSPSQIDDAIVLVSLAARQVLRRALFARPGIPDANDDEGYSRRVVHQATGMLLAQLDLPAADALLVLRGYAFSHGRTVRDVATDVVLRKISFPTEFDGS